MGISSLVGTGGSRRCIAVCRAVRSATVFRPRLINSLQELSEADGQYDRSWPCRDPAVDLVAVRLGELSRLIVPLFGSPAANEHGKRSRSVLKEVSVHVSHYAGTMFRLIRC